MRRKLYQFVFVGVMRTLGEGLVAKKVADFMSVSIGVGLREPAAFLFDFSPDFAGIIPAVMLGKDEKIRDIIAPDKFIIENPVHYTAVLGAGGWLIGDEQKIILEHVVGKQIWTIT